MKNKIFKNSFMAGLVLLFSLTATAAFSPDQPESRIPENQTNVREAITVPCLTGNCGKAAFDNGASVYDMNQWREHRTKIFGSDEESEQSGSVDSL